MRRRILEALVLLGLVAVLVSVGRRATETRTQARAALRDLAIDGLYPGMPASRIQEEASSLDTVYGLCSGNGSLVRFVLGQSLTLEGVPYLIKGDTADRVWELLGPPDQVVDDVWTYEKTFTIFFHNNRLSIVSSDYSYRDPYTDYYFIHCEGLSHMPPSRFYASDGSTVGGRRTLVVSPKLQMGSDRMFSSSWSGDRVFLDAGTVSRGQSVKYVDDLLGGIDSDTVVGGRVYRFDDFTLTVVHDGNLVVELKVEPLPTLPDYEGIEALIDRDID